MSRSLELMTEACVGLPLVTKRMFGGHAFYAPNGGMFAGIVSDDQIVLKLEGDARDELLALGGHPWIYHGKDKSTTMKAWLVVPDAFYDDTEELHTWLRRAHALVPPKAPRARAKKARMGGVPSSPSAKSSASRTRPEPKAAAAKRKSATKTKKRSRP